MSKVRLILLAALAVVVVGAVASASASAAECKKEATKKFVLCLGEPLTLTEGTFTIHVKTDPGASYVLSQPTAGLKLLSKAVEGLGLLISGSASGVETKVLNLVLTFTGVEVDGVENCEVKEKTITTEPLKGHIQGKEKIEFTPETGKVFVVVTFLNKGGKTCPFAGKDPIKTGAVTANNPEGGVLCTVPSEVTRVEQLFTCLAANSDLEFLEGPATFEGNFLSTLLNKGTAEKWAVIEGK